MGVCWLALYMHELWFVLCCFQTLRSILVSEAVILRPVKQMLHLLVFACRLWNRWGSLWLSRLLMKADFPCQSLSPSSLMRRKCFCQPAHRRMRYVTTGWRWRRIWQFGIGGVFGWNESREASDGKTERFVCGVRVRQHLTRAPSNAKLENRIPERQTWIKSEP